MESHSLSNFSENVTTGGDKIWEEEKLDEKRLEEKRLEEKKLEEKRLEEKRLDEERLEEERLEEERLEEERRQDKIREEKSHSEQKYNYNVSVYSVKTDLVLPLANYKPGVMVNTFFIKGSIDYDEYSTTRYVFGLSRTRDSKPDIILFQGSAQNLNSGLNTSNIQIPDDLTYIVVLFLNVTSSRIDRGSFCVKINC